MVSIFKSPLLPRPRVCWVEVGLPSGFLDGDISKPLMDPDLLVGGDVSGPWDEIGDLIGDGERLMPAELREVNPARCIESRLPAAAPWAPCSACTTSAKEMKLRRRTSEESSEP